MNENQFIGFVNFDLFTLTKMIKISNIYRYLYNAIFSISQINSKLNRLFFLLMKKYNNNNYND